MGASSLVLCPTGNRLQVSNYGSALSYPFVMFVMSHKINKQEIVIQSSDSNRLFKVTSISAPTRIIFRKDGDVFLNEAPLQGTPLFRGHFGTH